MSHLILLCALFGITWALQFSSSLRKLALLLDDITKTQVTRTGQQVMFNRLNEYYLIDFKMGIPDQNFAVAIDTTSSNFWLLDTNCTKNCDANAKHAYNATASQGFVPRNDTFSLPYGDSKIEGMLGKDVIFVSTLMATYQDFRRATVLPEVFTEQPFDGVLGFGWPEKALAGTNSVMKDFLPELDVPIITIWMEKLEKATEEAAGGIMYGGEDKVACDEDIHYVSLAEEHVWGFFMDGFSMGTYSRVKKEKAISATASSFTGVPNDALSTIIKNTKAKFDWTHQVYTVHCSTTSTQPDIILNIGGRRYTIQSENYVINIGLKNGQCALAFYGTAGEPSWVLGDVFIRSYCHVYDFGNARIGLAKFLRNDN